MGTQLFAQTNHRMLKEGVESTDKQDTLRDALFSSATLTDSLYDARMEFDHKTKKDQPFYKSLSKINMESLCSKLLLGGFTSMADIALLDDTQDLIDDCGLSKSQAKKLIRA